MNKFDLKTERFHIRPLTTEDVGDEYLSWFQDAQVGSFIVHADSGQTIEKLKAYVREKSSNANVLFLGIFDRNTQQHIGNIKYEPLDFKNRVALFGILIGNKNYRNKGVASEVLPIVQAWLRENEIDTVYLGVDPKNVAAIHVYEKLGFRKSKIPNLAGLVFDPSGFHMALDLNA